MARELELLEIWQAAASVAPPLRGAALAGMSADDAVSAIDARLFALRREWFGGVMRGTASCPACSARMDVELPTPRLTPLDHGPSPRELMHAASREALAERYDAAALEEGDVHLALACPECGAACDVPVDPGAFLFAEVSAAAKRVLRDVHALATAYGWSEEDVLAIPPARRRLYVELVSA